MRRWEDEERGGDWKMRREGEGPMGRWGDWENFYFSVLPSSLLPSSFFLLTKKMGYKPPPSRGTFGSASLREVFE
jgi:hypothetical protein